MPCATFPQTAISFPANAPLFASAIPPDATPSAVTQRKFQNFREMQRELKTAYPGRGGVPLDFSYPPLPFRVPSPPAFRTNDKEPATVVGPPKIMALQALHQNLPCILLLGVSAILVSKALSKFAGNAASKVCTTLIRVPNKTCAAGGSVTSRSLRNTRLINSKNRGRVEVFRHCSSIAMPLPDRCLCASMAGSGDSTGTVA